MADEFQHTHPDDTTDLLSALLDDALTDGERLRAQQLVTTCPGCRTEFADLQAMHQLLQDLPLVTPPRSFTLDPEKFERRRWGWNLLGVRVWGTALAALLVFALVGINLWQPGSGAMTSTASAPAASMPNNEMMRSMAQATPLPEVAMLPPASANAPLPTQDSFGATGGAVLAEPTVFAAAPFAATEATGDPVLKQTAPTNPAADAVPQLSTQTARLNSTAAPASQPTDVLRQTSPISGNQTADLAQAPLDNATQPTAPPEVSQRVGFLPYLVAGLILIVGIGFFFVLRRRR